jgi:hypothetical protein
MLSLPFKYKFNLQLWRRIKYLIRSNSLILAKFEKINKPGK